MSPEMETPKLMWLKRNLPGTWDEAGYLFDLADFLTWKATGSLARSQCTLTAKWTYLAHEETGWRRDFFETRRARRSCSSTAICRSKASAGRRRSRPADGGGGGAIGPDAKHCRGRRRRHRRLCRRARRARRLCRRRAEHRPASGADRRHVELRHGDVARAAALRRRLGAVLSAPPCPKLWLSEGGQSATGALLDHIIRWHGAGGEPDAAMHAKIAARVAELRAAEGDDLAARLHVLPDFHGNRSPLADPHALGVISGLTLDASFDSLCRLYWRTAVGIALGVRHMLEALNEHGYLIDTLHVTGGHTKQPAADGALCRRHRLHGRRAAGRRGRAARHRHGRRHRRRPVSRISNAACVAMQQGGTNARPNPAAAGRFDRDYRIFLEMHRQRQALDAIGLGFLLPAQGCAGCRVEQMDALLLECVAHRRTQHRAFAGRHQRADLLAAAGECHQRVIAVEFDEVGGALQRFVLSPPPAVFRSGGRTPSTARWTPRRSKPEPSMEKVAPALVSVQLLSFRPHGHVDEIHRRRADEAGDEQVAGLAIDLRGRADLLDAARREQRRCGRPASSPRAGRA